LSANLVPENSQEPRVAPLGLFKDNVAHSADSGLWIEEMLLSDGTTEINGYYPDPPYDVATFYNFTAYKCRNYGAWVKGSTLILTDFYVFDNRVQLTAPTGPTVTVNAMIIGETNNLGDTTFRPLLDVGRSRPDLVKSGAGQPLIGIVGYEQYEDAGPQYVINSTFVNLVTDSVRPSGAFSFRKTRQVQSTQSKNVGLAFINANKYYVLPNTIYDDLRLGVR